MAIELYTLNNDSKGPNVCPFVWRVIFALKHKGLEFEENKSTYNEVNEKISKLTNGKWTKVPSIKFADEVVFDSPTIIDKLEANYPENPLFPYGRNYSTLVGSIAANNIVDFVKINYAHILARLEGEEKIKAEERIHANFKETNEAFAKLKGIKINSREDSIKIFFEDRETILGRLQKFLKPFEVVLQQSEYLEGPKIAYSDFILYSLIYVLRQYSNKDYKDLVQANFPHIDKWVQSLAYLD